MIEAEDRTAALFSNWVDTRYNAGTFGANLLSDIIGEHNPFSYPKSIHTVGERDKQFVAEQKLTDGADEVFVNGDSFIPKAKALEPVFKNRMFSTVEV